MNTNPHFQTAEFKRGLCQLNFDTNGDNYIELLMPMRLWKLIDEKTGIIESVDIDGNNNPIGLSVNFVDGDKYNPYSVSMRLDQTNLVEFNSFGLKRIAQRKHRLKIYTEHSNEPVAEFENVKALRFDYQVTVTSMEFDDIIFRRR